MGKEISMKIKGVAILIMLCHHFIVMPFSEFPVLVKAFGDACKICVAIYAVLSGYGYYFSPIAKTKYDDKYMTSDEYILRKQIEDYSHEQITEMMR